MTTDKRFPLNLDMAAGLVTGCLLLALLVVIVSGSQLGVRVTAQLPANSSSGPYEALTFVFSEAVTEKLVINKFTIQPEVDGKFEWVDSRTMRFIPSQPYLPDTEYTLNLTPGLVSERGTELKKEQRWTFITRAPRVVYLVADKDGSQLWSVDMEGNDATALTDTSLKILNFDTAQNGEFIVFAAFNEQNGLDLWRVQRTGGAPLLLLQCGADRCSVPAISPNSKMVAYVREAAAPTGELSFGAPRIHIFNLEARTDAPLYEDQQIIGYGPTWSPDGTRLSSYDGIKDEIRLLDLVTSQQVTITSQTGSPVSWSQDGSAFIYTDVESSTDGIRTRVHLAKITINEILTIFGENDARDYAYNALAWSPVKSEIVLGLRPRENDPSMALWLMDPYTRDGQAMVEQTGYAYNDPRWDLWGRAVIFQQFNLQGLYKPQVALWMPGLQQPRVLAEGVMSRWLP